MQAVVLFDQGGWCRTNDFSFLASCLKNGMIRYMGVWWGMPFYRTVEQKPVTHCTSCSARSED
jgi:hypothetical protein